MPWTRATSSPPRPSRCTAINTRHPGRTCPQGKDFFFLYYEGQRNSAARRRPLSCPPPRSGRATFRTHRPLHRAARSLINEFTGQPFPGNQDRLVYAEPIACNGETISATDIGTNVFDPPSSDRIITIRADSASITTSARATNSLCGTHIVAERVSIPARSPERRPGFPVTDDIVTNSVHRLLDPPIPADGATARASFFAMSSWLDRR